MGGVSAGDVIPLLQKLQDAYGYLPQDVILKVSEVTGIPASRLYGVATFYAQFHLKPRGKHIVRICRGTACHVRGGSAIFEAVRQLLGVEDGETTEDMLFTLETVACLGACALSPVMVVDDTYHGKVTAQRAEQLLRRIMEEAT